MSDKLTSFVADFVAGVMTGHDRLTSLSLIAPGVRYCTRSISVSTSDRAVRLIAFICAVRSSLLTVG